MGGPNMIHFIKKIREIRKNAGLPRMIISQPCYGYPQVQAESDVINAGWNKQGESSGLVDSIGLMVYNGADSLNYVVRYSSVKNGFQYKPSGPWAASDSEEAIGAYKAAAQLFSSKDMFSFMCLCLCLFE